MAPTEVTIVRDRWGIGHATAADATAAFAAQGWLAAADRIWQMEWDRRRALGTWAEVAGPTAVAEDTFFRRLDLARRARQAWAALDEPTRAMTQAYVDGVNGWLAGAQRLPAELDHHPGRPARWEPWHCVAVYQLRHFFMGTFHRKLWRGAVMRATGPDVVRAMVGDPGRDSAMAPGSGPPIELLADAEQVLAAAAADLASLPDGDGGSNSWAVHGSRTASGLPLLAGDPHRGIEFPNVYHQCHVTCPEFDAIGLAFPGVPGFPHFGHTASVAWCITHGMADDTDVFVEHGPVPVERTELVTVRGADPVTVRCAETERGPVVLGEPGGDGPVLSAAWTGFHGDDTTFACLRPMLAAESVDELEAAMRQWVVPVNNVLSADVRGTISFRLRGRIVERPPANRWTPVPGDDDHGWAGREPVPFEDLHTWRNPDRGYLVTANNRTSDDGPYVSLDFAGPARHDRIVELLDGIDGADVAAMQQIHTDVRSLVAPAVVDRLLAGRPTTDAGRAVAELLAGWDGELHGDAPGPTAYTAARLRWTEEVGQRLGVAEVVMVDQGWPSPLSASRMLFESATTLLLGDGWQLLPGLGSRSELDTVLGTVLDDVGATLIDQLGPDPAGWAWHRVHTMVSPHALALARPELDALHPPLDPCPGDGDTVRCSSVVPTTGPRAAASSVARYVFDLADWDRSGWIVPHGVSGVRGSGHDLDQRPLWLAGELVPMSYSPAAVAAVARTTEAVAITLSGR